MNMTKGSKTRIEEWCESFLGVSIDEDGHNRHVALAKVLYVYDHLYRLRWTFDNLVKHTRLNRSQLYYYAYASRERIKYDSFVKSIYLLYLQEELEKGYKHIIIKK